MSYNDYSNYDDLFYDNNSFAIILLLLIFVSVIVTVVLIVIYKENKMKRAKEIAVCVFWVCLYDAKLRFLLVWWGGFFLCVARFFLFACLA